MWKNMNFNFIKVLLINFLINYHMFGQRIKVLDIQTLQPIQDVIIIIKDKVYGATNKEGIIELKSNGEDTVIFSHISYETKKEVLKKILLNDSIVYLTSKSIRLNEIVISAIRYNQEFKKVGQLVSVISDREIKFIDKQTNADILQDEAVVFVQKSQMGGGSPIIRGFEANKILLVIDGIRMNNAIYRSGHLQNIITIDPNSLEKIEVLHGPSSLMFGSDALGGSIYLKTYDPTLSDTNRWKSNGELMSRFSSANIEKTGHIRLNISNNKLGFLTTFTYSDFDDLRQGKRRNPFYGDWGKRTFYVQRFGNKDSIIANPNVNIQKGSAYSQVDFMQKALFKINNSSYIMGNIQYSTSSNIPRYDRLTLIKDSLPRFSEWYYGPQKRLLTYLKFVNQLSNKFFDQVTILPAYQNIEESRHNREFNNEWLNHRIEKVIVYSINTDFVKKNKNSMYIYGFDIYHEEINSSAYKENIITKEIKSLDTRYPDGGNKMNRTSTYFFNQRDITNNFFIQGGIRFNLSYLEANFKDTTFYKFPFKRIKQKNNALTGSIYLVYYPIKMLKINMGYSSGYRTPNLDDLSKIFETTPGKVVIPNENLKPEYTHTFDLGLIFSEEENYYLSLNSYYTLNSNIITLAPGTYNGKDSIIYDGQLCQVLINVNKEKAYLYGCNSFIKLKLNEKVIFQGILGYTYGRIKTDSTDYPLDHIPPVYGKVAFVYIAKKIKAEFNTLFNGWKKIEDYNLFGEDNLKYATEYGTPAWQTLNLLISYQLNKNMQLNFGVENVLDQNYRTFASGISAPGRNFKLSLRVIW